MSDLGRYLWLIPALPLAACVLTAFLGPGCCAGTAIGHASWRRLAHACFRYWCCSLLRTGTWLTNRLISGSRLATSMSGSFYAPML